MSLLDLRRGAEKWMQNLVVRMVVAALCLLVHVHFFQRLGEERFKRPFNNAPTSAPMFHDKVHEGAASHWDRLLVSRWDAQHYQGLALRGYETCKTRETLKPGQHPDDDPTCELSFYPTYGWLGRAVVKLTGLPIDYALFALSLACSLVFLTMLTGPLIVRPLGVWGAYLAMFLFNAFTTGFTLVTVQTEPCLLLLMILSLWLMDKRYIWAGAVVAGAATAIRITGVAVGFAYCAGLAVLFVKEGPSVRKALGTLVKMLVSGWGIIALLLYFAYKFGDPLIYSHAHGRSFNHTPGIARIFFADGRLLMQSIWAEPNEGLFLAAGLLWFLLGHRSALRGFKGEAQAFWYLIFAGIVGISMIGSVDNAYGGMSRYMLTALPMFFAMAQLLKRKPAVLAVWLFMSSAHYYNGSLCFYVGQNEPGRLQQCSFARHFRSDEKF